MKAVELREETVDELQSKLLEELRAQFNLRMRKGTGQLDKPDQMKKTRRNIARIKTLINEKKAALGSQS